MASWDEDHISVIDRVVMLGNRRAASDSPRQPLRQFLGSLPDIRRPIVARESGGGGAARPPGDRIQLVADNPWLLEVLDDAKHMSARHKRARRGLGPHEPEEDDLEDFGDDDLEPEVLADTFWMELAEAKALVSDKEGLDLFAVRPLGGKWTHEHLHVAFDAWQARAVSPDATDFLRRYGLQLAMRFDVSLYSNHGALLCANYWVAKMRCFYQLWKDAGCCDSHSFSEAEKASFREPDEFTELTTFCIVPAAQKRFRQLRELVPVGGGNKN